MHDDIAGRDGADLGQEVRRPPGVLALAHEPVAEDVLLGHDGEVDRLESLFQPEHGQRRLLALEVQRGGERGDRLDRVQPVVGQHAGEALARAFRPGGDDHVLAGGLQRAQVVGGGLEHVARIVRPFGREGAAGLAAGVDDEAARALGHRVRLDLHGGVLVEPFGEGLGIEVELVGPQGLVGRVALGRLVRTLAGVVIVVDLRQPFGRRLPDARGRGSAGLRRHTRTPCRASRRRAAASARSRGCAAPSLTASYSVSPRVCPPNSAV